MKIYAVTYGHNRELVGIFSTEERAKSYIEEKYPERPGYQLVDTKHDFSIEDYEVDVDISFGFEDI